MSSFDERDIRRTMDVYSADNVYLGTVLRIEPHADSPSSESRTVDEQPPEPGNAAHPFNGERLGPASTVGLGNQGPATQSSARSYGAISDGAAALGRGVLEVGKWWGWRGTRVIPLEAVQAVSAERVVLGLRADEL